MKNKLDIDMEEDIVTCDVPYGGVLLFSNAIPHRRYEKIPRCAILFHIGV